MKNIVKGLVPPILLTFLRKLRRNKAIRIEGSYSSWNEATKNSFGYDSQIILDKVLDSTLKVQRGEAVYERDSTIFDQIQYSWPVTAGLMLSAASNKGELSVLDFGGSLGSSYFQNQKFLEKLPSVKWSVVEQTNFVEKGKEFIQNEKIKFYNTIDECMIAEKPNVALFSSVLQYLEDPYEVLESIMKLNFEYVILDRTPFLNENNDDQIKIQVTPESIYQANYPIRFFNKSNFTKIFKTHGYKIDIEFESLDKISPLATWEGMIISCIKT